jgi:hypothetical protein
MVFEVRFPDSVQLDSRSLVEYKFFLQAMANRRVVGGIRYGDKPKSKQKYMTRLGKELKAYRATGNVEHLINIANYAFLESVAPEHKHQHWDASVESVTRKKEEN